MEHITITNIQYMIFL